VGEQEVAIVARSKRSTIDSVRSSDLSCAKAYFSLPLTAWPIPIGSSNWPKWPKRLLDGIFLWDHLLYAGGVTKILDPYISLAAIATGTSSIQLGAMVTPLNRRRPQVVARQAVTLDLLSNGRLILGFGIGDDGESGELSSLAKPLTRRYAVEC